MQQPKFLSFDQVIAFHKHGLAQFGGAEGVLDPGGLESSINAPRNLYLYENEADIFDCAAAYAFHLSKNHPFRDGNKRAALQAGLGFLRGNHITPQFPDSDVLYNAMIALTTGACTKENFASLLATTSLTEWFVPAKEPIPKQLQIQCAAGASGAKSMEDAWEIAKALIVDHVSCAIRLRLILNCETFCVHPKRIDGVLNCVEASLFTAIRADLRRAFGMK